MTSHISPIDGSTSLVVLLADPIAHAKTPAAMSRYLAQSGFNAVAVPVHVAPERLEKVWNGLLATKNLGGAIIGAPHKADAARLCDEVQPTGKLCGGVNIVRFDSDRKTTGDAFDGIGFVRGLADKGRSFRGQDVIIVGAGGVAAPIAFACASEGPASLTIANRDHSKAELLVSRISAHFPELTVVAGPNDPREKSVVVNATSLGLRESDPIPTPVDQLEQTALVADVIMEPALTPLLVAARERGCIVHEGKNMMVGQILEFARFLGFGSNASA